MPIPPTRSRRELGKDKTLKIKERGTPDSADRGRPRKDNTGDSDDPIRSDREESDFQWPTEFSDYLGGQLSAYSRFLGGGDFSPSPRLVYCTGPLLWPPGQLVTTL